MLAAVPACSSSDAGPEAFGDVTAGNVSALSVGDLQPVQIDWPLFCRAWVGTIVPTGAELGINWNISEPACHATTDEIIAGVTKNGI